MRVGYNAQLLGGRFFGVSHCIYQLANALIASRSSRELVLYTRPSFRGFNHDGAAPAVTVERSHRVAERRAGRILWEQVALPRRVRRDGIDLLHAPGYVLPVRAAVPVVLWVHDLFALTNPELCTRANRWHYRYMLPASIRRARKVVAVSGLVRDQIAERFGLPEDRLSVVAPGVDDAFRRDSPPAELERVRTRYALPTRFVLFPGNLEPKKNADRLVRAVLDLRRRGSVDGELVATGGGGWGCAAARREPAEGVRWLPYVPAEDMPHLFRLARVLAFPSLAEGFGIPVVEGMASGVPVVCSDVPACRESDPSAAVHVDPTSVDSIASGIERAWNDDGLRATLIRRGQHASASYTWSRAAAETWKVYEEALS